MAGCVLDTKYADKSKVADIPEEGSNFLLEVIGNNGEIRLRLYLPFVILYSAIT